MPRALAYVPGANKEVTFQTGVNVAWACSVLDVDYKHTPSNTSTPARSSWITSTQNNMELNNRPVIGLIW